MVTQVRDLSVEDELQWVARISPMVLRASYNLSHSREARTIATKWYTDMCNNMYALSLNESWSQVHTEGSGDAFDLGEGLARKTGKKKTKRYKSQMEIRAKKGRRQKVILQHHHFIQL